METSIYFITGLFFIVMGVSYLTATNNWVMWLEHVERQGTRGSLNIGMINLFLGAFILANHWIWQGSTMVLSIIAALMIVKGGVYLLSPTYLPAKLSRTHSQLPAFIRLSGFIITVLGMGLLYAWCNEMGYLDDLGFIGVAEGVAHVN